MGHAELNRSGFFGGSIGWENQGHGKTNNVFTGGAGDVLSVWCQSIGGSTRSEWAEICSIAEKFGCTAETLRKWVRRAERDQGVRSGLTTGERAELKRLRRECRELRRANEILVKASAYFARAELDRRPRS